MFDHQRRTLPRIGRRRKKQCEMVNSNQRLFYFFIREQYHTSTRFFLWCLIFSSIFLFEIDTSAGAYTHTHTKQQSDRYHVHSLHPNINFAVPVPIFLEIQFGERSLLRVILRPKRLCSKSSNFLSKFDRQFDTF